MTSGTEIVLAALAAGAGAGTSETAQAAVVDSYVGLRRLLRRRLEGNGQAIAALDRLEDAPRTWSTELGDAISEAGVDGDEEVLAAARALLAMAQAYKFSINVREAKGVQVGNHNVQHNSFS